MPELNQIYDQKVVEQINFLKTSFKEMSQDLLDLSKGFKKVDTSLKDLEKSRTSLLKTEQEAEKLKQQKLRTDQTLLKKEQELEKVLQQQARTAAASSKTQQQNIRLSETQRRQSEQLAKASKKAAEEKRKENSAYAKLNKTLGEARQKAKDLGAQYGSNDKRFKSAQKEVTKLDNRIKKLDKSLGLSQRNVGNYGGGFKKAGMKMAGFAAGFIGIQAGIRVLTGSIKTMAGFEKAMDKVQAVTGATTKEIGSLSDDAKRLGSETSKSASQVAGLQLEFSKLGFSTTEILAATEATIDLSIAAGSDLAESAVVAASTVRGFGLSANETQRVTDVMAKSFASSALDLEKFKTAMAAVAPVAKASGKDIEFATAQISILADSGLDASTAGTSLRNMFLELNKRGLTWEQGLEKINNSTNKNVTALELFGKRGATAALILADNTDKAEKLEKAYDGATGSAKDMATIMEDNLIGDTAILSSAWEGFILSLNSGEGPITNFFRNVTQWATRMVNSFTAANKSVQQIKKEVMSNSIKVAIAEDIKEIEFLTERIGDQKRAVQLLIDQYLNLKKVVKDPENIEVIDAQIAALYDMLTVKEAITTETEAESEASKKNAKETAAFLKAYKEEELEDEEGFFDGVLKLQERQLDERKKARDKEKKETEDFQDHLTNLVNEREQENLDAVDKENAAKERAHEAELRRLEEQKMVRNELFQIGIAAANILFDNQIQKYEEQQAVVEENYERDITLAGESEIAKRSTERRFAIEKSKIARAQAQAEKNQALFNIGVSTAMNVARVSWNPFLVTAVLALGALQAGVVASKPLPKVQAFDSGTSSAPGGQIDVAEKRPEIIIPKHGRPFLQTKPLRTNKLKGARIIGGAETAKIMAHSGSSGTDYEAMRRGFQEIRNGINNIKINFGYDNRGNAYVVKNFRDKTTYANYYKN